MKSAEVNEKKSSSLSAAGAINYNTPFSHFVSKSSGPAGIGVSTYPKNDGNINENRAKGHSGDLHNVLPFADGIVGDSNDAPALPYK